MQLIIDSAIKLLIFLRLYFNLNSIRSISVDGISDLKKSTNCFTLHGSKTKLSKTSFLMNSAAKPETPAIMGFSKVANSKTFDGKTFLNAG